jgi:predicted esterase
MKLARWVVLGFVLAFALAAGCGSDIQSPSGAAGTTGSGGSGGSRETTSTASTSSAGGGASVSATGAGGGASVSASTSGSGGAMVYGTCSDDPPPGSPAPPAPKAYSGGMCPMLMAGDNTFASSGNMRTFKLAVPANLQPTEKLPVVFMWHWLGGSAQSFYDKAEVQAAVDSQRFLAVLPSSKGDTLFKWPFETFESQARMDEEFDFFDDMLACVAQQFNVNLNCVSSAGVSAGALFTDQLAGGRGDYLSSIISLSGGVDGAIRPWGHPSHHMPALVLWGGPTDICIVINFQDASKALEAALVKDGNFILECIHNCGHSEPPFDAPMGLSTYAGLWQFVFDHPYWIPPGKSSYTVNGMPNGMPTWCGLGPGSAVPRVGPCAGGGC